MTTASRSGRARVNESHGQQVELAYDVYGERGRPLVLIMGIGAQKIFWDEALCEQFAGAGFQVVRFDHRDIGESTRLDAPVPRPGRALIRHLVGAPERPPYTLSDMATDVAGLIDALGFGAAHVVGASLGGMIGQHLAIEHPARVRSLTSIMSTPGGRRYLPQPAALRALFMPAPTNAVEAGIAMERMFTTLGGTWPVDGARLRAIGEAAHVRGQSPAGYLRQFAAVMGTPDRRPQLRTTAAPTLVIHGTRDPLFPLQAARDMVAMMPDARLLPMAGMGHDLPAPLWPALVTAIARHAEAADARATV